MKNERLIAEHKDAIASTIRDIQEILSVVSPLPPGCIVLEHAVTQYQPLNQTTRRLSIKFPNGSIEISLRTPCDSEAAI